MVKSTIKYRINDIPGDKWWWNDDTSRHYLKCAKTLIKLGMSETEAVDFLRDLFNITVTEVTN